MKLDSNCFSNSKSTYLGMQVKTQVHETENTFTSDSHCLVNMKPTASIAVRSLDETQGENRDQKKQDWSFSPKSNRNISFFFAFVITKFIHVGDTFSSFYDKFIVQSAFHQYCTCENCFRAWPRKKSLWTNERRVTKQAKKIVCTQILQELLGFLPTEGNDHTGDQHGKIHHWPFGNTTWNGKRPNVR